MPLCFPQASLVLSHMVTAMTEIIGRVANVSNYFISDSENPDKLAERALNPEQVHARLELSCYLMIQYQAARWGERIRQ